MSGNCSICKKPMYSCHCILDAIKESQANYCREPYDDFDEEFGEDDC